MALSRLTLSFDLDAPGHHIGDLRLRWSDNQMPLGYYPIPVISIHGGPGPRVLILGGTHGDEFEGPAAIMRLAQNLTPADLAGQVILIPALNAPALRASARVSPLDGANLNRAFPGDPDGGPTAMLAHYIETVCLPRCAAVIDLHSGGKASVFAPCTLATQTADPALYAQNLALARAFGLPLIWRLGALNDNRSVNSAAERQGIPMIATELGGGGGLDPHLTDQAEAGLRRCLQALGLLPGTCPPRDARIVELAEASDTLYAPATGLFDRALSAGDRVRAGAHAGWFHYVTEPERPSVALQVKADGVVLAHSNRGLVARGDLLLLMARDVAAP